MKHKLIIFVIQKYPSLTPLQRGRRLLSHVAGHVATHQRTSPRRLTAAHADSEWTTVDSVVAGEVHAR
jgi:hypothetical protein